MQEPEIPWIYLAMVAIIFIRWLMGQLKKAAQIREAQRRRMRRRWEGDITEDEGEEKTVVFQQPTPPQPPPRPEPATPPPLREEPREPQTLQELFEQRRREIAEAQRRAVAPPPVPVKKPEPEPEPVVKAPAKPVVKKPVANVVKKRRKSDLVATFSDSSKIRNAIILKEILGKPKGLE